MKKEFNLSTDRDSKGRFLRGKIQKGSILFQNEHIPWNKGKSPNEETRKKIGKSRKGKGLHKGKAYGGFETQFKSGIDHPYYNPSKQKYGLTRQELKKRHLRIKKIANFTCQYKKCNKCNNRQLLPTELNVHHKDGNKKNYNPKNIIVYCIARHISEQWKIQKYKQKSKKIQKV